MSPLRERMIEDMTLAGLALGTRQAYTQGSSMLWYSNNFEQVVDTTESGAVTILTGRASLVGLEDVEGETTQAGEHAGVGANAAAVFAEGDVAAVM